MKSICGSLEASSQTVIILYLFIRGLLPLPWTLQTSSHCMEDSLGRVACLPSLPMASLTFAILSIIKCIHDLNIYPLVHHFPTQTRLKLTLEILIDLLPTLVSSAVFRIATLR